jgi:hypothetical protein
MIQELKIYKSRKNSQGLINNVETPIEHKIVDI